MAGPGDLVLTVPALRSNATSGRTLLWSGGIGDFLHYVSRLDGFLDSLPRAAEVTVFVEATNPDNVRSLLGRCLAGIHVEYVPARLHWTKTNPLLDPTFAGDRADRPAFRYLAQRADLIEDWFLPSFCQQYPVRTARLDWLRVASPEPAVAIAARDKGFLWFPEESLVRRVAARLGQRGLFSLGTADEALPYLPAFEACPSAEAALIRACAASLLIGVDTGMATARELLGLPNVYCVSEHWLARQMKPWGYWGPEMAARSRSRFAYDGPQLEGLVEDLAAGPAAA